MLLVTGDGGFGTTPAPSHPSTCSCFWPWYFGGKISEYYLRAYSPFFMWFSLKFGDVIFSDTSFPYPHHIDRFRATCSLHSQEAGEASYCQILSFILPRLQQCPLQHLRRRKLPLGSTSTLYLDRPVCTMINSVGLAGERPVVLKVERWEAPNTFPLPVCF